MVIKKFEEFNLRNEMVDYFLLNLNAPISESKDENIKTTVNEIVNDLNLDSKMSSTFEYGVILFLPIVSKLITNTALNTPTDEKSLILLTLSALAVIYLEENKSNEILKKDTKSILEELKLRGIGNGIVDKVSVCIKSIKNIFQIIGKYTHKTIKNITDIFVNYSVPILNSIISLIMKYGLDLNNLSNNLLILSAGITSSVAKNGIKILIDKLFNKPKDNPEKLIHEKT